jgi:NADH-quinone oxidoreductase subunit I
MAKTVPRPQLTAWESAYFGEILRGLWITLRHAARNLLKPEAMPTLSYPEQRPVIPRDYRARHRLMQRPDGSPRCVACMMCSTACPARCIEIVAEESEDPLIEKRPARFEIDLLLCVFCGYCVEACPCDAIRMDTGIAVLAGEDRAGFIICKEQLLDWKPGDYPADDLRSQEAPGGRRHAEALRRFRAAAPGEGA